MYNNKTIKELKQILEDHNCAIPNGAKKKDLVELVEAVMAKDEDFVTMQIESPDDMFDELFDDSEQEESKEVVIEESVGEEKVLPQGIGDGPKAEDSGAKEGITLWFPYGW